MKYKITIKDKKFMINVCIDGNYIFHKTFGIFAGYGTVDPGKVLKDKGDQAMFIRKISTDLCSALKMLPAGGRLVFTSDSRSWRKDVEIENGGYKSGRVKDENVDWSIFFELLQSFGKHLEKMGFIFSKVDGAEGDDLLLFWSRKFNQSGESCIIISGDRDLHQLARIDNGVWTAVWSSNSKKNVLTVPENWSADWLNENKDISVFNMGFTISPEKEKLKEFIKKVEVNNINSKPFLFNKILVGDKGDSVPSVWEYESGGKIVRFTDKKAETVYEYFMESQWKDVNTEDLLKDEEFLSWISALIMKTSKDVDSTENRIKAKDNFLRNFKLMWLDPEVIPSFVSDNCYLETERGIKLEKKAITLDRIKILDGTEWVATGYQPKEFDPFKNLLD
jgi:5'-3' exonuclease